MSAEPRRQRRAGRERMLRRLSLETIMSQAIVVHCSQARGTCFLALPLQGFEAVSRAVFDAAVRAELRPLRAHPAPIRAHFVQGIFEGIPGSTRACACRW